MTIAQLAGPAIVMLHQLQSSYIAQANALYNDAVTAHQQHTSATALYKIYFQRGIALENNAQAQVNQILFHLKDELQAKHLPIDIVTQLRDQYNEQAQAEMKNMASHVVSALHSHS